MHEDIRAIFSAGLAAVDPHRRVKAVCRRTDDRLVVGDRDYDLSGYNGIYVIGAGKASAAMAAAIEDILGERLTGGLINVKYGYTVPLKKIRLIEAGHPVPDQNGLRGASEILDMAVAAGADDLVICLVSGGGSALLPLPVEGITLADKQQTIQVLLSCGAAIQEINTIRKHLSAVKGGRLARAVYPATLVSLIISDVVGNDPTYIASGPTVPDTGTFADCLGIVDRYGIADRLPARVLKHLEAGTSDPVLETPSGDDAAFERTQNLICAGINDAIIAAAEKSRQAGYRTLLLSSTITGETREIAGMHAAIARESLSSGHPVKPPACILSGGETTVTIRGRGLGGRNQEFCLAVVKDIAGLNDIVILSGGTDGTDGPTDAAGAVVDSGTLEQADRLGMNPDRYLADNNAYAFFKPINGLLMTGPTNTNVMDLRIMLISRRSPCIENP
jgi:hydroxypyruvate reductase